MKYTSLFVTLFILSACTFQEKNTQAFEVQPVQFNKMNEIEAPASKQANDITIVKQKDKVILDVPLISQNPELKYGCEVTSLTMLLNYAGHNVDKMTLAKELKTDDDPIKRAKNGDITNWGDPDDGFVGDITGQNPGYAVFDKPLEDLMKKYMKDRTLNLTGQPFERSLEQVAKGIPVVVWTTGDYRLPDRWEAWRHGSKLIKTPLDLHAVVLVGYEENYVYLNDPLSVKKNVKVNKEQFIRSWIALKERALTYE